MGGKSSKQVKPNTNGHVEGEAIATEDDQPDGPAYPNIINVAAESDAQTQLTERRNRVTTLAIGSQETTPSSGEPYSNRNDGEEPDGMPTVGGDQHHALIVQFQTLQEAYDNLMQVNESMGGIQQETEAQLEEKENEIQDLKIKLNEAKENAEINRSEAIYHGSNTEESETLNAQIVGLRESRSVLKTRCETLKSQKQQLEAQLAAKDVEIDELKTRLSRIASDKLKDDNPNIADLSDKNRPDKLAERFGELYCNEWTDVMEEFTSDEYKMSEKEVIYFLYEFVKRIYEMCYELSTKQLADLRHQILMITGHAMSGKSLKNRPELSTKPFKEERKKQYKWFLDSLMNDVKKLKSELLPGKDMSTKSLKRYLKGTTEICWLMCIQDPPVVLYFQGKKGGRFDETYFTAYTNVGNKIAYVVWPAILLYKDGPVIHKGVAQGKTDSNKSRSVTSTHDYIPETSTLKSLRLSKRSHTDPDL